jgi:DNA (cytosine-5)-methyltransferase 1
MLNESAVSIKSVTAASNHWIQYNKIRSWPAAPELSIVDLFSGCGGLTLGASIACEQLNRPLKVCLGADMWPEALEVYKYNFKDVLRNSTTSDLSTLVSKPGSSILSPKGFELASSFIRLQSI